MAYAAWLTRWRLTHWSNKLLVGLLITMFTGFCVLSLWVAMLPATQINTSVLPQYASLKTGSTRFPVNLPEPAAGQSTLTVPLNLPERPAKPQVEQETANDSATPPESQNLPTAASPRAQTPRKPLEKVTDIASGLPIIAADGTTPFDAYRVRTSLAPDDERARLALIVVGTGLNSARSQNVLEQMPSEVTIAVSPYAQTPQRWVDEALSQGRDVLVMVPMEPNSYPSVDPGPYTLLRDSPAIQTMQNFHTVLAAMRGYVGIINDTGSRFTANEIALAPVLDDVAARGLMVVDARASAYSVLASQAKKRGIPVAVNTRYVDSSLAPNDIDRQLRDLERTAQTLGTAVGVLRDFPVSLERVDIWQKNLDSEIFVLTPISAVANRQPIR